MTANQVWTSSVVPNGKRQFFATVMVLQYLAAYRRFESHKARIMAILAERQR